MQQFRRNYGNDNTCNATLQCVANQTDNELWDVTENHRSTLD